VGEGERVARDAAVAQVFVSGDAGRVKAEIAEIDSQIDRLEKSVPSASLLDDLANLDGQIEELLTEIRKRSGENNYRGVEKLRDDLNVALSKRGVITRRHTGYDGAVSRLKDEKARLEASLGQQRQTVRTPVSGFYYGATDGYEGFAANSDPLSLTAMGFRQMMEAEPDAEAVGGSAGKIAPGYTWYYAAEIGKEQFGFFEKGEAYELWFPLSGVSLPMRLAAVNRDHTGGGVLVFECGIVNGDMDFSRAQNAVIYGRTYSGLRIPNQARSVKGNVQGVYIISENTVQFREITVLYSTESYSIVKIEPQLDPETGAANEKYPYSLRTYDMVIVSGRNIYEGRTID